MTTNTTPADVAPAHEYEVLDRVRCGRVMAVATRYAGGKWKAWIGVIEPNLDAAAVEQAIAGDGCELRPAEALGFFESRGLKRKDLA
jgi:hypothetical protein